MANTHETIADIIAAKRRLAAEMGKALGDQHTSVEMLKDDADRLEAAHRREMEAVGDAAKLREACANIAEYARSAQCHTEDAHVLGCLNQIEGWAKAALAAAHKLEAQSIERIVRDAIIDYTEQYPHAPNDDVERELKARANTANEWLKQHGFAEEPTNWSKEEMPCL